MAPGIDLGKAFLAGVFKVVSVDPGVRKWVLWVHVKKLRSEAH